MRMNRLLLIPTAVAQMCFAQNPLAPGIPAPRPQAPATIEVEPAQRLPGSLGRSVPQGKPSAEPLVLTIKDTIERGLKYNLALVDTDESVQVRRAQRLRALSALLPNVSIRPSISEQQTNLAALGFSGFPGLPSIVGPFTVYDARASATQSLLNFQNLRNLRAARESVRAAEFASRDVREEVVLAVAGLYLQAVAGLARIEAQRAQVSTADTAHRQALDRKSAGTIAGIDVLRAQVELQSEQQRLYYYEGEFDKQKLDLARAIGLAPGQAIELQAMPAYEPLPDGTNLQSARSCLQAESRLPRSRIESASGRTDEGRRPGGPLTHRRSKRELRHHRPQPYADAR